MYPYPTVAASNPRSAYSRPETVSAMHPSPKSASRREFGTLRPRKGTLKYIITFHSVTYSTSRNTGRPSRQPPPRPARADRKNFGHLTRRQVLFLRILYRFFRRPGNNPCPRRRRQRSVVSRIINTAPTLHACDTAPRGACGGSPSNSSLIDPIP